jgi:hypothetical protein
MTERPQPEGDSAMAMTPPITRPAAGPLAEATVTWHDGQRTHVVPGIELARLFTLAEALSPAGIGALCHPEAVAQELEQLAELLHTGGASREVVRPEALVLLRDLARWQCARLHAGLLSHDVLTRRGATLRVAWPQEAEAPA